MANRHKPEPTKVVKHKQSVEVEKISNEIDRLKCATMTSKYSLSLTPGAHIQSYRELCSKLYVAGAQMDYFKTIINFLVGDALNQGEQVYGEESACIFGVDVQWSEGYVHNVRRIASVIPPEYRDPRYSWHFYMDLAGSSLSPTELAEYIDMARAYQDEGHPNWRSITVDVLNDRKVEEALEVLGTEGEKTKWRQSYRQARRHWRTVKKEIEQGKEPPEKLITVRQYIIDLVDKHPQIPNNSTVRDAVIEQMWELHDNMSKKTPGIDWRNA